MSREEKVMEYINKAEELGYVFLSKGMGVQDDALETYRAQGYDVRGWYTYKSGSKDTWQWIMYGKMKGQRRQSAPKKIEINYEEKTVKELKEICKVKSIAGYYKMNKQQMIETLKEVC